MLASILASDNTIMQNLLAIPDAPQTQTQTASKPDPAPPQPREPLKHLLIGSPKGVIRAIHALHVRGYAPATHWSPLIPTGNQGEVMSILVRYLINAT